MANPGRGSTTKKVLTGLSAAGGAIGAIALRDLLQKEHTLKHNFPVVANARYLLERIGPELRQYIVTSNDEERPFSRDQRSWVYASAKLENNYTGFGTDNDVEHAEGYVIVKHRTFTGEAPSSASAHGADHSSGDTPLPAAKVIGSARGRPGAFRPASLVNISGMSFGSLSGPAVAALNEGALLAGAYQNTGEGALSDHHRRGGDIMFQIGTSYFGCRDEQGRFDLDRLVEVVSSAPVKAIEIKLSQGAKPGLGGLLPAAKITAEIAAVRGIPLGQDCASPSRHTEFTDVDSMLDFVERVAAATGLPVGIKSAVGDLTIWEQLAEAMTRDPGRGVDFITIDGGEGGTGAAPMVFTDSVALPFRVGFSRVYAIFARAGLTQRVTFIGAGKLGLPENALVAMSLGVDVLHVGREAMLAIGCIQAQKCHTDHCPTGIATQNRWLVSGLDPHRKAARVANYLTTLRRDLLKVSEACGVAHPALIDADDIELVDANRGGTPLREVFGYRPGWGSVEGELRRDIEQIMAGALAP